MKTKKKLALASMAVLLSVSACSGNTENSPEGDPNPGHNSSTSSSPNPSIEDNCPVKVPGRVFNDGGPVKYSWQGENGRLHVPDRDAWARPELIGTPGHGWTGCNRDPVPGARWSGGPYKDTKEMADEFMRVFGSNCIPNPGGPYGKESDEWSCDGYDWSARIGVVRPGYSPEDVADESGHLITITGENWYIQSAKGPTEVYLNKKLAKASN